MGEIFSRLKEEGLYNRSLIIFTSDHGEEFQEHGEFIHNQVYEENIRIPLLIKFPGDEFADQRTDLPVSLVDIMPTILDLLDIPPRAFPGKKHPGNVNGKIHLEPGDIQPYEIIPIRRYYSLIGPRYKLIYNTSTGVRELYDLAEDPLEKVNQAEEKKQKSLNPLPTD